MRTMFPKGWLTAKMPRIVYTLPRCDRTMVKARGSQRPNLYVRVDVRVHLHTW